MRHPAAAALAAVLHAATAATAAAAAEPLRDGEVRVHRGSAAPPAWLAAPAAARPTVGAVGGDRVWFVDPAGDRLVGCRLARTADVGRSAVRCAARRLPLD